MIEIAAFAFFQQIAGRMSSRSGNRDKRVYHGICSLFSHSLFAISMYIGYRADFTAEWIAVYSIFATLGNLVGAEVSMTIERRINALADSFSRERT